MKNKLLITLALLLTVTLVKSQEEIPYKPLAEFGNDTTAFVMYNFWEREVRYEDKTLKEVIDDYSMPINDILPSFDRANPDILLGFDISVYRPLEVNNRKKANMETNSIRIYLKNKPTKKESEKLVWSMKQREWKKIYNKLKDEKVGTAHAVVYRYSPYYEKYNKSE